MTLTAVFPSTHLPLFFVKLPLCHRAVHCAWRALTVVVYTGGGTRCGGFPGNGVPGYVRGVVPLRGTGPGACHCTRSHCSHHCTRSHCSHHCTGSPLQPHCTVLGPPLQPHCTVPVPAPLLYCTCTGTATVLYCTVLYWSQRCYSGPNGVILVPMVLFWSQWWFPGPKWWLLVGGYGGLRISDHNAVYYVPQNKRHIIQH